MMRFRLSTLALAFSLSVCTAAASSIVIYNTGESTGNTALPTGTTDPNYTLVSAPAGVPSSAVTTSPNPAWVGNTSTAEWISPGSSSSTSWPGGNYEYQTTFSLAGLDPTTAQLSGSWTSDNNGCIYLNGADTGDCTTFTNFGSLASFSITSGFAAGTNTLDLIVANGAGSPTGVFAEVSGTAVAIVPEPASLTELLMGIGLLGLAGAFRRGRKSRA